MPFGDSPIKREAGDVDRHIGARLRGRRTMLGMSIESVAVALGLAADVYERYESGSERIPASVLFEVSKVLRVAVRFVFDRYVPAADAAKLWADHPLVPRTVP
ncbi:MULTISPECIES: helix-turn-helix domain-containing protein [Asticcacaulis]|uniref:helix-turn-helix domain-containing protein n=1 Tax=Asticcacaulis TaxID=76890 RepID=UPI001AE389FD|nr:MULTISPECIES: helix-turn-helix transcriptional regulator [Asticcacaulis]MBP2159105.1 transcriptional regulator with XRE-family HTH domain [Asticcacaulis solisilvae]MDR6800150.1 transcriptional regulator with XRE-family HTH domain [Asticcacaulis sp. BE141]